MNVRETELVVMLGIEPGYYRLHAPMSEIWQVRISCACQHCSGDHIVFRPHFLARAKKYAPPLISSIPAELICLFDWEVGIDRTRSLLRGCARLLGRW